MHVDLYNQFQCPDHVLTDNYQTTFYMNGFSLNYF